VDFRALADWAIITALPVLILWNWSWLASRSNKLLDSRVTAAEQRVENEPEKAKPAWDLARATLEAYFARNLVQINYIFYLSIVVIVVGFVITIWGLSRAFTEPDKWQPSLIAASAGTITQFIGATFLFIYRSTLQQAVRYTKTLERINSVGMAMAILDTMSDDTDARLKSKTKAELVKLLVKMPGSSDIAMADPDKRETPDRSLVKEGGQSDE
jgi:nitrate reductase gamma subunit